MTCICDKVLIKQLASETISRKLVRTSYSKLYLIYFVNSYFTQPLRRTICISVTLFVYYVS